MFFSLHAHDRDGYYEAMFHEIERRYYTAMKTTSLMTNNYPHHLRADKRLALCQQRLWDMAPDFVDFFDTLRAKIPSIGHPVHCTTIANTPAAAARIAPTSRKLRLRRLS